MQGVVRDDNRVARCELPTAGERTTAGQELAVADKGQASVDAADVIAHALMERIGQEKYRIWFQNSTRFTCVEGYLKIGVPNLFMAKWLESHFLKDVKAAAFAATGGHPKVSFVVDSGLCGVRGSSFAVRHGSSEKVAGAADAGRASWHDPRRAGTFALQTRQDEKRATKYTLDTFVVGPSNELAHSAAKAVVHEQQSPFNPLFIHGGSGVGKTHLLHGICNGVLQARPQTNWLYLSAEDFANQFVLALKTKKLEAFRHRMRQTDLLAIDDVHFLASKPSTQEEFLHTFNTVSLAGKQIVLVSDAHPKMIGQLSEKLVNRFISGMVVKIEPPDLQTRCEICRRFVSSLVARRPSPGQTRAAGDVLPEAVIRYVAERVQTNVRELEGAMLKLVACASLTNGRVTLAMAQQVLAEHLDRCNPVVHVSDIETAVAAYFGTTPAHVHSAKKDRTVSLARHFSMYLTRKHTAMSSSEVGRVMGNKNHATVLMACKKIEEMLRRDEDLNWRSPNGNKCVKARSVLSDLEAGISH